MLWKEGIRGGWSPVTCKTGGARRMRVLRQQDDAGGGRVGVSVSERNSKNALLSKASIFFRDDFLKCTRSVKMLHALYTARL